LLEAESERGTLTALLLDTEGTMIFAQGGQFGGGGGGAGGGGGPSDLVLISIIGGVVIVSLAIGLAIQFFFLSTLARALKQCAPRNRTIEPGQLYFNLIPCFNLIWTFIIVNRMTESLRNEFRDRGLRPQEDYGQSIGTTYAVLVVCSMIPYLGSLIGIGALVCWIIYWVKMAGLGRELQEAESYRDDDDRDYRRRYDEDDDPPRRSRQDRDDTDEDDDDYRPKRRRRDDDD
jgi:hypothetical protein